MLQTKGVKTRRGKHVGHLALSRQDSPKKTRVAEAMREVEHATQAGKVVLLTGLPGSGKTTLARQVSGRLNLPLLSEDVLKESLFESLGARDREESTWLGAVARKALLALLRDLRSIVVDAFWTQDEAERLPMTLSSKMFVQVHCSCDPSIAMSRYRSRAARDRHPGHHDEEIVYDDQEVWSRESADPPTVSSNLILVDTTCEVDVDAVARRVHEILVSGIA